MFSARNLVFMALAALFVGQVTAVPMPMPLQHARDAASLGRREPAPLDTIPAYVKRDVNTLPEQVPTKSDQNGKIIPYVKRADVNTFPAEQASMSPNGVIEAYSASGDKPTKRDVNTMPEQVATKSDPNGKIIPYVKRADVNTFPVEQASMAPDGVIVPYSATGDKVTKRDVNTMPEQVATKSDPNGKIIPYVKRADVNTFPVEQASMAPDGVIVPYTASSDKQTKRDVNTMPEQVATKSDPNGKIIPYVKRADVNTFPVEQASMAPDGVIVPYSASGDKKTKRDVNTLPEQVATKSDQNGKIIPYVKRADVNTFPVEQASMAPDGVIVPYAASGDVKN